ncbi:MerR family transcriptional regulator [Schaalia suimastitidis]|uniref:MerR family transcriptional regulator n=1 Tax=Schaalia suimastitidis TaxID=121163 RepID=UPI000425A1E3|nr:MerR family transcriptional regulator [Schaalia suimastitidis]
MRIGEVSELFGLPVSTLRYYDSCGFFPRMKRAGGQRIFSRREIEAIETIECLKKSGLSIDEIRRFISWCEQGDVTLKERLALFTERKQELHRQMSELRKVEAMLNFKLWYYERAVEAGTEGAVKGLTEDQMPEWVRTEYQISYSTSNGVNP